MGGDTQREQRASLACRHNADIVFKPLLSHHFSSHSFSVAYVLVKMDYHFHCAKGCFREELLAWFENVNSVRRSQNLPVLFGDLDEIATLYGRGRLEQEYQNLIDQMFSTPIGDSEETQDPFGEPLEYDEEAVRLVEQTAGQRAVEKEKVNFAVLFKLKLVSETEGKRFGLRTYKYEVVVAPIQFSFTNTTSIEAVPKILEAIFDLCTASFLPTDRIIIEMGNDELANPFCLQLHSFSDFKIQNLFDRVQLMNSGKTFKIDETF